ncbi:MAG: hypothetical protein GY711_08065 [bacterium]|nr:hypothetical protein [bacterium]
MSFAGRRIERLGHPPSDAPSFEPGALCAAIDGFSLHAQGQVEAGDRERLEHLCRYVARPPIATERLSLSPEGNLVYELRRPWRDGTTHFVFAPLTFLERLAALVPHSREHMVTSHAHPRDRLWARAECVSLVKWTQVAFRSIRFRVSSAPPSGPSGHRGSRRSVDTHRAE